MNVTSKTPPSSDSSLPQPDHRILRAFTFYTRWLIRRNFCEVRASFSVQDRSGILGHRGPVVVYLNHPSWWDPLACLILKDTYFAEREAFAPIDARALARYGLFNKLGFFGVQQDSLAGARQFIHTSRVLLSRPSVMLWLTPQGALKDVRERPVALESGVAHLCRLNPETLFLPLALEYAFTTEREPALFARFGRPVLAQDLSQQSSREVLSTLTQALEASMTELAGKVIARDMGGFDTVCSGTSGTDAFYGIWLRLKAFIKGQKYRDRHDSILESHAAA